MDTLYKQLKADLLAARKLSDNIKKSLLSTLIGDIDLGTRKKEFKGDVDQLALATIKKYVDNANEMLKAAYSADTLRELEILNSYLPKLISLEELTSAITQYLTDNNITDKRVGIKSTMEFLSTTYPNVVDKKLAMDVINTFFDPK